MANKFLKVGVIAQTMIDLLFRELVIARTVWTDAVKPDEFVNALDDTVTLRVPARRTARTRTLRGTGNARILQLDDSNEFAVPVKLDSDIYNGAPITDEELDLDIVNFAQQVLMPQVRAVAEGIEDKLSNEITNAGYTASNDILLSTSDPYDTVVDARKILNDNNVPKAGRTLLVGSAVEAALLKSDDFVRADARGPAPAQSAFEESVIGRVAGFTVLQSNGLPEDEGYAYHRTAFVMAARTPKVPQGATFGQDVPLSRAENVQVGASMGGLSARWIMDYDPTIATDRSFTSTWVGTATVEDPDDFTDPNSAKSLLRAVRIRYNAGS
jgi:hypothetical protein